MSHRINVLVLSDIHYASDAEKARGHPRGNLGANAAQHALMRAWDHFIWMRDPLAHNPQLDRFLDTAPPADYVVANGDFSCDSACIGMSDDASLASALECLGKLRARFGERFRATIGDHELGKISLLGGKGGMRLASWQRTRQRLQLDPVWTVSAGEYLLVGVTSSLLALPVFQPDTLPEEFPDWENLRVEHLRAVRDIFSRLQPRQRVLLFCHDPSALPFLWEEPVVRARIGQVERTIIGHLHSGLVFWKSRMLAGIPRISFLGNSVRRMSSALNRARHWRPFKPLLCPSLAGIELLNDGGFYAITLDPEAREPAQFQFHPLKRVG